LQFPDGLQQPFFFLFGPATPLLLDRAKLADFFVDADQVFAKLLETMELRDLLLSFAKRGRIGKGLSHGPAGLSASEAELGIMTGIVGFGAMTRRFTAAPDYGSNRTGPKIAQAEELLQEFGSTSFQGRESIGHIGFPF
jgi:hypothetical protein